MIIADQPAQPRSLLAFEGYVFDLARGILTAGSREVILRPKTAAVLTYLLEHAGQVVAREKLMTAVWGNLAVTDDSLTQCVSEIRRALGTGGAGVLQTHARRGYMMATKLRPIEPTSDPSAPRAPVALARHGAAGIIPASKAPRSRVGSAALVVGGCALALSAGTWIGTNRATAPEFVASAEPSSGDQARRLLEEGRIAQQGSGSYQERLRASLPLFLRALALDPHLAEAAAEATFVHVNLGTIGASQNPEQDRREAQRLAALAMTARPEASLSLAAHAATLWQQRRFAEARIFYERAGTDPARVSDRANVGIMHLLLGDPGSAQPLLRAALLDSPRHLFSGSWRGYLGLAKLLAGQPTEAAGDFLVATGAYFPAEDRLLYRLVALRAAGRLEEAETLDATLRQRDQAPLVRPLRAFGLSDEAAYRAHFERAVLTPLREIGWVEVGQ